MKKRGARASIQITEDQHRGRAARNETPVARFPPLPVGLSYVTGRRAGCGGFGSCHAYQGRLAGMEPHLTWTLGGPPRPIPR